MTIFEVGRICYKLAGRDAGQYCVVIKQIDSKYVEIDGQTRRRKCNIDHLEPLDATVDIKEGASNKDVAAALTKAGYDTAEAKKSDKKPTEKPVRQRVVTEKIADTLSSKATGGQKPKASSEAADKKPVKAKSSVKKETAKKEEPAKAEDSTKETTKDSKTE